MSKARSPRFVCSTTIGINTLNLLPAFLSLILCRFLRSALTLLKRLHFGNAGVGHDQFHGLLPGDGKGDPISLLVPVLPHLLLRLRAELVSVVLTHVFLNPII